jgi:myo-inositol-1(or 4)-monophosphatase
MIKMISLHDTQRFLRDIILEAGQITLHYRRRLDKLKVSPKAHRDSVTEADIAVEQFLIQKIRQQFPDHAIFGEESGQTAGNDYRWVIDPIDGTTSFMHGQPFYSISVALEYKTAVILGAVYLPAMNELFEALQEQPATLNGSSIRVARQNDLGECVLATGFACLRQERASRNLKYLAHLLPHIRDIRRCGSAAMDLCYVACGRFDGFWELNLNLYDIAAGAFIAEQAGAVVSDFSGTKTDLPDEILCANTTIHSALQPLLWEAKKTESSSRSAQK